MVKRFQNLFKSFFNSSFYLVIILILVVNSCKKESATHQNNPYITGGVYDVSEFKTLFNKSVTTNSFQSSTDDIKLIHSLNINWNSNFIYKRKDSALVAEFTIGDSTLIGLKKYNEKDTIRYTNKTCAVFIKSKSGQRFNFLMKVVQEYSTTEHHSSVKDVHYQNVPSDFTGIITFYSLDSKYLKGIQYYKGVVRGYIKPQTITSANKQLLSVPGKSTNYVQADDCGWIDVYQTSCEWGGTAADPYANFHGCTESYIGSYFVDCGGQNGGGTVPGDPGSTGGGGSSGGGTTNPTVPVPCPPSGGGIASVIAVDSKIVINVVQPPPPPPTDPGNPTPNPCVTMSPQQLRESTLQEALVEDDFLLLDCNVIQRFKALATFAPPSSVLGRVSYLNKNAADQTLFSNPYYVQLIKDAAGIKINLDRFEINVSQLPIVNGSAMTASSFLDYIRLNINNFIDNNVATFQPYNDPNSAVNDANLWNSSNPTGAILHLDMLDNGSVIMGEKAADHWTVSTLRTPLDGTHPVSGNRSWGYISNGNGGYTFYVTGADRLSTTIHELAQEITGMPFKQADKLWMSYQTKLTDFVNTHGGAASVGSVETNRTYYAQLVDYLAGKISLDQLKAARGCK